MLRYSRKTLSRKIISGANNANVNEQAAPAHLLIDIKSIILYPNIKFADAVPLPARFSTR